MLLRTIRFTETMHSHQYSYSSGHIQLYADAIIIGIIIGIRFYCAVMAALVACCVHAHQCRAQYARPRLLLWPSYVCAPSFVHFRVVCNLLIYFWPLFLVRGAS